MTTNIFNTTILLICMYSIAFSQGENCSNAMGISSNSNCAITTFTINDNNSGHATPSCLTSYNDDMWFTFTATHNFSSVLLSGDNKVSFTIYEGSCGALTELYCSSEDAESTLGTFATVKNNTYLIRTIRSNSGNGTTSAEMCIQGFNNYSHDIIASELFNNNTQLPGAQIGHLYGGGTSNHNGSMIRSGNRFGWFNVKNGVSNVSIYDRLFSGLTPQTPTKISFWTRESYGNTQVTYSVKENNTVIASKSMTLTPTYEEVIFNINAATSDISFEIFFNDTGDSGKDIVMEDLVISQNIAIAPLPIELGELQGECSTDTKTLHWTSITETDNKGFVIEKSTDLVTFEEISFIDGAGNSTSEIVYTYDVPNTDIAAYYRIKQIDFDNTENQLGIIHLECQVNNIEIFPNPAKDQLNINLNNITHDTSIKIYNFYGRLMQQIEPTTSSIDISHFPKGVYLLESGQYTQQFLKL